MIMSYFDLTVLSLFSGVQCVNVSTGYPWFGIVDWYWTKMFSNDKTLLCDIYCYLSCSMLITVFGWLLLGCFRLLLAAAAVRLAACCWLLGCCYCRQEQPPPHQPNTVDFTSGPCPQIFYSDMTCCRGHGSYGSVWMRVAQVAQKF